MVDRMFKLQTYAGAEDLQSVDYEHDRLLVTASALNTADTEEYRRRVTH